MDTARRIAVQRLEKSESEGTYINLLADDAIPEVQRARVREYVSGVVRQKRYLDFLISRYYRGKMRKMHPRLRQILRLGIYELLFMDRAEHGVVHEAVELARRQVGAHTAGLVNAILRRVLREREALPLPETGDRAEDLAIRYSYSTWMVRRWLERWGPEATERLLRRMNERPYFSLRIHTQRVAVETLYAWMREHNIPFEPSPWLPEFVRVPRLQEVIRAGWLKEGYCAVQDEGAALVARLVAPAPGERIIDACAAPGGKTLYMAQMSDDQARIEAVDIHPHRVQLIESAAQKAGLTSVHTHVGDACDLLPRLAPADRVLLDVPCTGTGVLARRPDLRWQRQPEDLAELMQLQDALLDAGAEAVRPGGVLVYATCSLEPEENEERVAAFLQRHPEFELEAPLEGTVPQAVRTPEGYMQTLPHVHGVDGAFAARLRKKA